MTWKRRKTVAALAAGLALTACSTRHEQIRREFSAPLERAEGGGALSVKVFMMSGGVQLRGAADTDLYRGTLDYCQDHMAGSVGFTPAGGDGVAHLDVSVHGLPDAFLGSGEEGNGLVLELSRRVPLSLDFRLGSLGSILDLSGLMIDTLDLEGGAGDMWVVFGAPNPGSAREIAANALMGDISIDRLGNANAGLTVIHGGLGTIEVDLRGQWLAPGRVVIEASVGDVLLKLPEGLAARFRIGEPWSEEFSLPGYEYRDGSFQPEDLEGAASVEIEVEAGIGKLTVETL